MPNREIDSNSLIAILKESPIFSERIKKLTGQIKNDLTKIDNLAEQYNTKYKKQIDEGTVKRQILLTEGLKKGKSTDEVLSEMSFIPSVYTPKLNWLYFFMYEHMDESMENKRSVQDTLYIKEVHEQQDVVNMEKIPELFACMTGKVTNDQFQKLKKLKRLAVKNNNVNESREAYKKCLELCEFFDIDFNVIPVD